VLASRGAAEPDGRRLGAQIWAAAHGGDPRAILEDSVAALIEKAVGDYSRANVR
jgi:hypothetical protein